MTEKLKKVKVEGMELMCNARICFDAKTGAPVLDLRETDCDPAKAQEVLKRIIQNPSMEIRLPKVVEKPKDKFTQELNEVMQKPLTETERNKEIRKVLKKHGIDQKYFTPD